MSLLRPYIRKVLLREIYELDPEDSDKFQRFEKTFGAIPSKVKKHQTQSGIAKRPNQINAEPIEDLNQLSKLGAGAAEEVLLENWTVIGTYKSYPPLQGRGMLKETKVYIRDSLAHGLPCNLYWNGTLNRVENQADYDAWIETEKKGKYYV